MSSKNYNILFFFILLGLISCDQPLFPGNLEGGTLNGESWSPEVTYSEGDGTVTLEFKRRDKELAGEDLTIRCISKELGTQMLGIEPTFFTECGSHVGLSFSDVEGDAKLAFYQIEYSSENLSFVTIDEIKNKKILGSFMVNLTNVSFSEDLKDEFPLELVVEGDFESKKR